MLNSIKEKWKKIRPFTFLNSIGIGIAKVILAIVSHSIGLAISSLYNFIISLSKVNVFSKRKVSTYKKYAQVGGIILLASVLYINYSIAVKNLHIRSHYHMYVALLIATVTFTDIVIAIIGIIKSKKNRDVNTEMLKFVNLCTALISLTLTQSSILSFTMPDEDMSMWNGMCGICFGCVSALIGIYMIINGIIKNKKESL